MEPQKFEVYFFVVPNWLCNKSGSGWKWKCFIWIQVFIDNPGLVS